MKAAKLFIVTSTTAAVAALVACERKPSLKTDEERASYAVGMQIGRSLKAQNADIVVSALTAGLNDGLGGKESKLNEQELQAAMQKMQEIMAKKAQEQAEKNLKAGEEWLAKNKTRPGVITTESGLQIEVLKEGTGPTPTDNDIVKVHYTGTLITGEKFDSSRDRNEPAEFPVRQVIPGWTEALKMMKAGSHVKLAIPPKLAYGAQQRPGIPANSTLLFDVELLEVRPMPTPPPPAPEAKADNKAKKK